MIQRKVYLNIKGQGWARDEQGQRERTLGQPGSDKVWCLAMQSRQGEHMMHVSWLLKVLHGHGRNTAGN